MTTLTTTNQFGKEVFKSGSTMAQILAFALMAGTTRSEEVIKNTYTAENAGYIFNVLNSVK